MGQSNPILDDKMKVHDFSKKYFPNGNHIWTKLFVKVDKKIVTKTGFSKGVQLR